MATPSPGEIRVLVVDDHTIVREGICALLSQGKDIQVVGQAADGNEAIAQVAALHPDVVLMDIAMPKVDGLEATRKISEAFPSTRILVLTQHESMEYVLPLLRAGAAGYILKLASAAELIRAIHAVRTEGAFLPPKVLHTLVEHVARASSPHDQPILTEREKEILRLVAEGFSGQEVAARLCISTKTVITHRSNIMGKIGVHNTAELIKYAIRQGIVKL